MSSAKGSLALGPIAKGDGVGAEKLLRESLEVDRRVFGETHTEYAVTLDSLGHAIEAQGRLAEAEAAFAEALRIAGPQMGDQHPRVER